MKAAIEERIKPVGKVLLAGAAELQAAAAAAVSTPTPVATVLVRPAGLQRRVHRLSRAARVGALRRSATTRLPGPRIAKGLDTLHIRTRSRASRARRASCHRRAAARISRTRRSCPRSTTMTSQAKP